MIYLQLFWRFLQVGMFSAGGGYASIPLIQSQIVEICGWRSMSEFANLVTIAEMTPGPIAVNAATFTGIRIAGIPGALIATAGCILPSCILLSVLACVYRKYHGAPAVGNVLAGLRPAVVALIAAAGLAMLKTALFAGGAVSLSSVRWASAVLFAGAFFALRKWKRSPILIMCLCGAAGVLFRLITGSAV